jgi:2-polyprenyl-6-methoxyphenol hydroxylase-like FAD-dependent oxidoreductase
MGGLPAARALADYFEHVTVLERDTLPLDASPRTGTPQARHTHALLAGGQRALGNLFPRFEHDLACGGAVPLRVGLDLRFETPGYDPFPVRDLGFITYSMSRPLIEFTVRQRVGKHANITICEHCRAQEVVASPDGSAVSAIRFENSDGRSEILAADLGFLAYAQQLRTPTIYDAIKSAGRQGEVARFGFPASVRRHFDRLEEFPRGLLPFGDAICRFNPVYGQGMSVAAQEAFLLRELLRGRAEEPDPLAGLASAFFAEAAALIETPWALAAVPDFAVPKTEGKRPEDLEQALEFGEALNRLAAQDAAVHKLFAEVLHLLKPRSVLRDPDLVERVKAVAAEHRP